MKIFLLLLLPLTIATSALAQDEGPTPRKPGSFGISVKAGPAFPIGEFSDLFKTGFTGFVDVPYNLSEDFQVYLGFGLSHFSVDNAKLSGGRVTTNVDVPYQVIPIVLGLNYCYRYRTFWPYLTISLGMYFQKLETSGSVTVDGIPITLAPKTDTWSQGAFAIGVGTVIPLGNEGFAFDVNAKFNTVVDYGRRILFETTVGNNVSTRAIRYVSILGGISYTFQ